MALKAGLLTRKTVRGCAILVILVCYLLGLFERAELIAVDLRYHLNSSPALPELLLVVIDQTSLKESSQWPWPRGYYADLIAKLRAGDAKLIALDLDFSASSHALEDQKLVHASSAAGNVILSAFHEDKILYGDVKIKSANLPFPELASAAAGMGSILFPVDPDGTMRRAYLVDQIHGTPVLSLAAEITRQFSRESRTGSIPRSGPIQIGQHTIRPGTDGTFYINYAGGPGSFPSVSFVDVLEGRIDPSRFRDKIVLVGASAMELRDIWNTPFGLTPGVEIQANTVQTLLSGKTIYRIPPWATLLLIVFGSLLSEVLFSGSIYRRHIKGLTRFVLFSALTVGIAFLFGLISLYVFKYWRILLDTVPVFTAIIVHYVFASYALNLLTSQSVEVKKVSLSTLHSVGNLSLKKQPLDNALDFILAMLKGVVDIRYMIVDLYHPKTQQPLKRLVYGEDLNQNDHKLTSQCQSWVDKAVASKESIIVPNLKTVLQDENSIQPEIRSSLFVPLLTHQQQHGVLHAHRLNSKRFEEEDVKMLYTVANQLAMNLENMELVRGSTYVF
jgi:CHASE2 domain-containing sensor protein